MANKAYNDGFKAGFEGRPSDCNPFPSYTAEFNDWDSGHSDGEYDATYTGEDVDEWDEPEVCDYEYRDSMDGDFDSAMTSAGFGTDEDYGDYGYDDDGRYDE